VAETSTGMNLWLRRAGSSWMDITWVVFVGGNLVAMRLLPAWQTVPFLVIWVSLTLVYGLRLWRLQPAILTVAAVTLATGGVIGIQVIQGQQDADYLAEVPLIALMFVVMMWQGRRRIEAMQERLVALEQLQQISEENLRLLEQQRLYLLDASHELGTPITVALGHAELLEQSVAGTTAWDDAKVVVTELGRLRRLAGRLLLLAAAQNPGFLNLTPVAADSVVIDAVDRWAYAQRHWRLGDLAEVTVPADRDRLATALDALLENAVAHTEKGDRIELSARLVDQHVAFTVEDSGSGIPEQDLERIFNRFSRVKPYRSREVGGFGLGLPVVQAITEAHHGTVRVSSATGKGSTFELLIPVSQPPD
jgi:two-component system OmpR family sensor kinase